MRIIQARIFKVLLTFFFYLEAKIFRKMSFQKKTRTLTNFELKNSK